MNQKEKLERVKNNLKENMISLFHWWNLPEEISNRRKINAIKRYANNMLEQVEKIMQEGKKNAKKKKSKPKKE